MATCVLRETPSANLASLWLGQRNAESMIRTQALRRHWQERLGGPLSPKIGYYYRVTKIHGSLECGVEVTDVFNYGGAWFAAVRVVSNPNIYDEIKPQNYRFRGMEALPIARYHWKQ